MAKKTTNKKVLRAMSIGLAAMMAIQPVLATPVLAEDTEGANTPEPVEESAAEETVETEQNTEETATVEETVTEAETAAEAVTTGARTANESTIIVENLIEKNGEQLDDAMISVTVNKDGIKDEAEDVEPAIKKVIDAGNSLLESVEKSTVDAEDAVSNEVESEDVETSTTDEVDTAEEVAEAVKVADKASEASEEAEKAEDKVNETKSEIEAAMQTLISAENTDDADSAYNEVSDKIAAAEEVVKQYGENLAGIKEDFEKASEEVKAKEAAYNDEISKAESELAEAEEAYETLLDSINAIIGEGGVANKTISDYEKSNAVAVAITNYNLAVRKLAKCEELGLEWSDEDTAKDVAERIGIAKEKLEAAMSAANAEVEEAEKILKDAEDAWNATYSEGVKALIAAKKACDESETKDDAKVRVLFEEVLKNYYVPKVLVGEGKSVSDFSCEFVKSNEDEGKYNYFKVTYTVTDGDNTEEVTKYLNYKMSDKNRDKDDIVIFEKTDELRFTFDRKEVLNVVKKDLEFNEQGEAFVSSKYYVSGKEYTGRYTIINVDGQYFALKNDEAGNVAGGTTTDNYSGEQYTKENEAYTWKIAEDGELVKIVTGDVTELVIRDYDTEGNRMTWSEADALRKQIISEAGDSYVESDTKKLRVTWREGANNGSYESAIFDEDGKYTSGNLYDSEADALKAANDWAKDNYRLAFDTARSSKDSATSRADSIAKTVLTYETSETINKTVVSAFDTLTDEQMSDENVSQAGTYASAEAAKAAAKTLTGKDIDDSKIASKADTFSATQDYKVTFETKIDLNGIRVTSDASGFIGTFTGDKAAKEQSKAILSALFEEDDNLRTILSGYSIEGLTLAKSSNKSSEDIESKDDNSYISMGTETQNITDGALYITYSKKYTTDKTDAKSTEDEAKAAAQSKYEAVDKASKISADINNRLASWVYSLLANNGSTQKGWLFEHATITEGEAGKHWENVKVGELFGADIIIPELKDNDISVKSKSAATAATSKTMVGDAASSVESYLYSFSDNYDVTTPKTQYYFKADYNIPDYCVIGNYGLKTTNTELSTTKYVEAIDGVLREHMSNGIYDYDWKHDFEWNYRSDLFFTDGVYGGKDHSKNSIDEGYAAWYSKAEGLNDIINEYKSTCDEDGKIVTPGVVDQKKANRDKVETNGNELVAVMKKAESYKNALNALIAQSKAVDTEYQNILNAKEKLAQLKLAYDAQFRVPLTDETGAQLYDEEGKPIYITKLAALENEVKAAQDRYDAAVAELEEMKSEAANTYDEVLAQIAEAERIAAEQAEAERVAAERAEAERLESERAEAERIAAERAEAERLEAERAEAERLAALEAQQAAQNGNTPTVVTPTTPVTPATDDTTTLAAGTTTGSTGAATSSSSTSDAASSSASESAAPATYAPTGAVATTASAPIAFPGAGIATTPATGVAAAPAAGVAGARTANGTGSSASTGAGTVKTEAGTDILVAEDEATKNPVAITDEVLKTIKDEQVPLASFDDIEQNSKMNWWWLLLIAALGATGEEMYRRNKKKKEEIALNSKINKDTDK